MSPEQLQRDLAQLAEHGSLLETTPQRQIWSARLGGQTLHVHFYPSTRSIANRRLGAGLAGAEFANLQLLQKKKLPAPRVIATLGKFKLGQEVGDANLIRNIPSPANSLALLAANAAKQHRPLSPIAAQRLLELLIEMNAADVSIAPLTLEAFSIECDRVVINDGRDITPKGLNELRLRELAMHSVRVSSRSLRLRAERALKLTHSLMPTHASLPLTPLMQHTERRIKTGGWTLTLVDQRPFPLPRETHSPKWDDSIASVFGQSLADANARVLKSDDSSRVTAETFAFADDAIDVVVKEPGFVNTPRGFWRRFRPSRVMRTWRRAWELIACGLDVEVPVLVAQRRVLGVLLRQRIVFYAVEGTPLDQLAATTPTPTLMRLHHRVGRAFAQLEAAGFVHTDAKSSNWIARSHASGELRPVMVDLDAIRPGGPGKEHVERFLRSLRETNRWHAELEAAVWFGYRPRAFPMPAMLVMTSRSR